MDLFCFGRSGATYWLAPPGRKWTNVDVSCVLHAQELECCCCCCGRHKLGNYRVTTRNRGSNHVKPSRIMAQERCIIKIITPRSLRHALYVDSATQLLAPIGDPDAQVYILVRRKKKNNKADGKTHITPPPVRQTQCFFVAVPKFASFFIQKQYKKKHLLAKTPNHLLAPDSQPPSRTS